MPFLHQCAHYTQNETQKLGFALLKEKPSAEWKGEQILRSFQLAPEAQAELFVFKIDKCKSALKI